MPCWPYTTPAWVLKEGLFEGGNGAIRGETRFLYVRLKQPHFQPQTTPHPSPLDIRLI
jgi:hypothetical protein